MRQAEIKLRTGETMRLNLPSGGCFKIIGQWLGLYELKHADRVFLCELNRVRSYRILPKRHG